MLCLCVQNQGVWVHSRTLKKEPQSCRIHWKCAFVFKPLPHTWPCGSVIDPRLFLRFVYLLQPLVNRTTCSETWITGLQFGKAVSKPQFFIGCISTAYVRTTRAVCIKDDAEHPSFLDLCVFAVRVDTRVCVFSANRH